MVTGVAGVPISNDRAGAIEAVVVSFNTRALLEACLDSLARVCPALPVTVVDNASTDGSVALVTERFPRCRLVAMPDNRGFAAAVNAGVAATEAPFVFILNADTAVEEDPLPALALAMQTHPRWAVAGPRLVYPDGRAQESRGPFPTVRAALASFAGGRPGERPLSADVIEIAPARHSVSAGPSMPPAWYLMGAALLFRRDALVEVGSLDESYFFYLEEVDWFRRAARAGWGWGLAPQARVVHHLGASLRAAEPALEMKIKRNWYRSRLRYFRRHGGRPASAALRAASIPFLFANAARHQSGAWLKRDADRALRARVAWGILGDYVLARVERW
jgi:N-acetylglucosaminyl-diphospho-decaprenol L-rhamnosyltransferase